MIPAATQKTIRQALRPFVENGLIPSDAWNELQEKISDEKVKAKWPELWTRKTATGYLQCSKRSLINYEESGKLKPVKIAGKRLVRYRAEDIMKLLEP